ncbi:MAG: fatty acid desaturase [Pseudomonadota bacterium]
MKHELDGKAWSEISGRAELHLDAADRPALEQLKRPDGAIFSLWVMLHLGLWGLGAIGAWFLRDTYWVLVCSLLLGSQLHAITILQHDCGHGSAYRSPAANLWVGRVLAWFIFMPFTTFTHLHKRHHAFLGQPDKDPDEWFYAAGVRWLFLREMLFLPRFIYESLGSRLPERLRQQVWRELAFNTVSWLILLAAAMHFDALGWFVMACLLPMALLALVINPISRGYEHFPMAEMIGAEPQRLDLRANTVTVTSKLLGLLWANITYHVEHHVYPNVPFYRLPAVHVLMRHKRYCREPYPLFRMLPKSLSTNRPLALPAQETEDAHR